MSEPITRLLKNLAEVERLLKIHSHLTGSAPGRKHNVEVLNKSAIVLLVACWEAYIEDICSTAFEFMLANATSHVIFPDSVLTLASKPLKAAEDNREVWALAGDGWRVVLQSHKSQVIKEYIGKLNTPKTKQVDALILAMLGLPSISKKWCWHSTSAQDAGIKLDKLVELRGSIAHQVSAGQPVRKSTVDKYAILISRIAIISNNRIRGHIHSRTEKYPWQLWQYGSTT